MATARAVHNQLEMYPRRLLIPADAAGRSHNNLDALRLGLALMVAWSHCFAMWFGTERNEWMSRVLGGVYNSGNLGVLGFFTISGFLITMSYTRSPTIWSYLGRRVRRIYPGYLVAILLCSLVVVPVFSSRAFFKLTGTEVAGIASNLLLRNYIISSTAFGGGPVNGSLWSIPYEFWCYLGILALGLGGLIQRRMLFPVIAALVMAVRIWLDMTGRKTGGGGEIGALVQDVIGFPYFWFVLLPSFMLGATVYQYRDMLPRSGRLLTALVLATIVSSHVPLDDPLRLVITRTLVPPTFAYLVFYLAFAPGPRIYDARRTGDFSYGTYLYAYPIQQMLVVTLRDRVPFAIYVLASLTLAVAAGALSWTLVERWFERGALRRRTTKPLDPEAAPGAAPAPPGLRHMPDTSLTPENR